MLLEIGVLKRKKQKTKKDKTKQNKSQKKKRNENCSKSGLSTTKDVMCCFNGYIYHFLDYNSNIDNNKNP